MEAAEVQTGAILSGSPLILGNLMLTVCNPPFFEACQATAMEPVGALKGTKRWICKRAISQNIRHPKSSHTPPTLHYTLIPLALSWWIPARNSVFLWEVCQWVLDKSRNDTNTKATNTLYCRSTSVMRKETRARPTSYWNAPPLTGTSPELQELPQLPRRTVTPLHCCPAALLPRCPVTPLPCCPAASALNPVEMLSFVRVRLVPALKLYLLGFKVLLTQLFSKPFGLPGQSTTAELGVSEDRL